MGCMRVPVHIKDMHARVCVFLFPLSLLRDDAIASPSSDLSTAKMVAASNITIATSQRPHPHR